MKKTFILLNVAISALTAILVMGFGQMLWHRPPRIGYVQTQKIMQEYAGFHSAQQTLQTSQQTIATNVDTLARRVERFQQQAQLSGADQPQWQGRAEIAERELEQYIVRSEEELEALQQKLFQQLVQKIGEESRKYGQAHGYQFIFSSNEGGNIVYGAESDDLTDQILLSLNQP